VRDAGGRSSDRERKTGENAEVIDDDKRDRRKVAEIMRRMEERKAAKELEMSGKLTCKPQGSSTIVDRKGTKEDRTGTDPTSKTERRPTELQCALKKTASTKEKTETAEMAQRNVGRLWASGEVSDFTVVMQSTGEKGSTRQ